MKRKREKGEIMGEKWKEMKKFVKSERGEEKEMVMRKEERDEIMRKKEEGLKIEIIYKEIKILYGVEFRKSLKMIEILDVIVEEK